MAARIVVQWPDARLTKSSKKVTSFNSSLVELAEDLCHTMISCYGAGLAAPQVGIHQNVCVISKGYVPSLPTENFNEIKDIVVLVNPEVQVISDKKFKWEEACLSVPDIKARVERHDNIKVTYQNLKGETIEREVEGIESATIQHETDHLVGKLFIHRLTGYTRQSVIKKLQKKNNLLQKTQKKVVKNKIANDKKKDKRLKRKKKNKLVKANRRK